MPARFRLLSPLLAVAAVPAQIPPYPIDLHLAARAFAEARAVCTADGGRLWGIPLAGPMLFVDPASRALAANCADGDGLLLRRGEVHVGQLPAEINIANMACEWAGKRWTMVIWPLPDDATDRASLMAHELFHRIQPRLGLPQDNPGNAHLDARDGRIALRLELRALAAALRQDAAERKQPVRDALAFRRQRQASTPGAAEQERQLELNEGLAEYTGRRLAQDDAAARRQRLAAHIAAYPFLERTLMRSFAYLTGPAYGLLLDEHAPDWHRRIDPGSDLAGMLRDAYGFDDAALSEHADAAGRYDGDSVVREEDAREAARLARLQQYRRRYVTGPTLRLSLVGDSKYSFDPTALEAFADRGTVYPTLRVVAPWGILEVDGGALIDPTWTSVVVPAPDDVTGTALAGDGWRATLREGVRAQPGAREGDWRIE